MPWCLKSLPFVATWIVPVEVSHFAVVVLYISQWMVDRQAHGILKIFSSGTRHVSLRLISRLAPSGVATTLRWARYQWELANYVIGHYSLKLWHPLRLKIVDPNLFKRSGANIRRQSCVHHGHAEFCWFCSIPSTALLLKQGVFLIMIEQMD